MKDKLILSILAILLLLIRLSPALYPAHTYGYEFKNQEKVGLFELITDR